MDPKLIIVSNRLPIHLEKRESDWMSSPSSGGLVSALDPLKQEMKFLWIGWAGAAVPENEQPSVREMFNRSSAYQPVFLSNEEVEKFYNGFSNSVLWPLFHYFPERVDFSLPFWDEYKKGNEKFAAVVLDACKDDTLVWVHDYHLLLLPKLLREARPKLRIGFFLHIPFPSSELYRLLPVRRELLEGVLGSDLIGFQTHDYARYFAVTCSRILGLEIHPTELRYGDRKILYGTYPIGIDPKIFGKEIDRKRESPLRTELNERYSSVKLVLGVDRSDYSKGLPHKLRGFERFLELHPEWKGKVVLLQVAVPSRTDVREYQRQKDELDQLVGRINGRFGAPGYTPIQYFVRDFSFEELCALYERADVLLVTSIRDGMNLVCLEYSVCQRKRHGVLVLSEFAGAARSLSGALLINPWETQGVANAIHQALAMEEPERAKRAAENYQYAKTFSANGWATRFLGDLRTKVISIISETEDLRAHFLNLKIDYVRAAKRFILLDYDGTLVPFAMDPKDAKPPKELLAILGRLSGNPKNLVYVISGRTTEDLDKWFGQSQTGLAAEHGMFLRKMGSGEWKTLTSLVTEWKEQVAKILKDHADRIPGSFVEEKKTGLAWHYRAVNEKFGEWQALELKIHLEETLTNLPVTVMQANKVVEVRPVGINKGLLIRHIWEEVDTTSSFVLAMGDDQSDEEMFEALPPTTWTCRVGVAPTRARFNLRRSDEVLEILNELSQLT